MKQFNGHHLRTFIDKARGVKSTSMFTKHELDSVIADLSDLLLYIKELENKIRELETTISEQAALEVEMVGDKF